MGACAAGCRRHARRQRRARHGHTCRRRRCRTRSRICSTRPATGSGRDDRPGRGGEGAGTSGRPQRRPGPQRRCGWLHRREELRRLRQRRPHHLDRPVVVEAGPGLRHRRPTAGLTGRRARGAVPASRRPPARHPDLHRQGPHLHAVHAGRQRHVRPDPARASRSTSTTPAGPTTCPTG